MGERSGPGAAVRDDSTRYGNPLDFGVDLHSVYAAYLGFFEADPIDWWERSWGGYFQTFGDFLGFKWEVMDSNTGKAHIATRTDEIARFAKLIKTRFGESLLKYPTTVLRIEPVPTKSLALRRLSFIHDIAAYRKLSHTLPPAELTYLRSRVKSGEADVIEHLFNAGGPVQDCGGKGVGVRDNGVGYTWASIATTWWEKGGPAYGIVPGQGRTQPKGAAGKGLPLEVGTAVLRSANLRAIDVWPPIPEDNYRKSHLITAEWVDKRPNTAPPSYPRNYGFGQSRFVNEKDIEKVVDATLGALSSQENDSNANQLILLTVGEQTPLPVPITSTIPSNILSVDILALEYSMYRRNQARGAYPTPERHGPLQSLYALLQVLQVPISPYAPLGNAGNEAFYTLMAFQTMMMGNIRFPSVLVRQQGQQGLSHQQYQHGPAQHAQSAPLYSSSPMPYVSYAPPPPFVDTRRQSNSSLLRPDVPPSVRRSSDNPSRPRPSSLANPHARQTTTGIPTLSRSQTVFWDDSEFAAENAPQAGTTDDPVRGRLPPPAFKAYSSSRSISWDDSSNEQVASMPPLRQGSSNASSPARPSQRNSASASSLRLAEPRSQDQSLENTGSSNEARAQGKKSGKEPKAKLKSEKSVKDIAGALARFWVG